MDEINTDILETQIDSVITGGEMDMLYGNQSLGGLDYSMIESLGIFLQSFQIITFLLSAWGLYMITKKVGEKYAWLSFIPLLQLYNYFAISKRSVLSTIVYPIIALIIGMALSIFTFGISMGIAIIYMFVMIIKLYSAISTRCGRGNWTTVGFLIIPFIMFPIVGYKLEDKSGNGSNSSENTETENNTETEDKVEY